MDATRIHIFLNYVPLIGISIGAVLLLIGMWRPISYFTRASLGLFIVTAVLTLVVYATGETAGKGAHLMAGPPWTNIVAHRASALPTFFAIELTGIFALIGLIRTIKTKGLERWNAFVLLILAFASILLAGWTTHVGRQIFVVSTPLATPHITIHKGDVAREDYNTEKKLWLA